MLKNITCFCLLFVCMHIYSQEKLPKWAVGVGGSIVSFTEKVAPNVADKNQLQIPNLDISVAFSSGISINAGVSFSVAETIFENEFHYSSYNASVRYNFKKYEEKITPYVGLGASLIADPGIVPGSRMSYTGDLMGGVIFWVAPRFGINTEIVYKHSPGSFENMKSHSKFSLGLVYSFKKREPNQYFFERRKGWMVCGL